jgi:hypothetical protein
MGKEKPPVDVAAKCACQGCKTDVAKFSFCTTHYEYFKFGLIKKDGTPVSDYDRKFEHFSRYFTEKGVRKAA